MFLSHFVVKRTIYQYIYNAKSHFASLFYLNIFKICPIK